MPCRVDVYCTILKTEKIKDPNTGKEYYGCSGTNRLVLLQDEEVIASIEHTVSWEGGGSPYPTPPNIDKYWKTEYNPKHKKFKRCFFVNSDRESEIFIHHGHKSYGCFMLPNTLADPSPEGIHFMDLLVENKDGLTVLQTMPEDKRSDADKLLFPLNYAGMPKWIG